MKTSIIKSKYIYSTTTIIFVILAWVILSNAINNTYVFPTVGMLFKSVKIVLIDNFKIIAFLILKILISISISSIMAFLIFLLYIWKKNSIGFFTPILSFIHVVPTMGISIYLNLFLDKQVIPFALAIMVMVPIMIEGLTTAYDNIDKSLMDMIKLEQIPFFKKIFKIYLPIILPYILMSILQSFSLGVKAMIMGEYLSLTKDSVGILLYQHQTFGNSNVIIVILISLFIISMICEVIIKLIQSKIK